MSYSQEKRAAAKRAAKRALADVRGVLQADAAIEKARTFRKSSNGRPPEVPTRE